MHGGMFNLELHEILKKGWCYLVARLQSTINQAKSSDAIKGNESLKARMTLENNPAGFTRMVDGGIALEKSGDNALP